MTLVRTETRRGHGYKLDGKKIQGVTTLLNAGLPKPALINWAARTVAEYVADNFETVATMQATMGRESLVAALKETHRDKKNEAGARGTEIHALAEQIIHGQEVEVPEHLLGYVQGYVDWLDAWGVEPVLTERPCASRKWWYAGTFDAVLYFSNGALAGKTLLCDWKTSSGIYGETALQLTAYGNADFYLDADGNEQPMPKVDGYAAVHVTPTGTDLYVVNDPKAAWKAFQHVQFVAKQLDTIKAQISEPLSKPALAVVESDQGMKDEH